nr:hypothetical protein [Tanacetum cinerariifolium]
DVMEMEPDIENMTMEEYLESDEDIDGDKYYKLPPLNPCFQTPQPYINSGSVSPNENDELDIDNMTIEEVSKVMGDVMQSFTSQAIHITPPDDACVVSATNHILDELLKEFGDELLDTTMVDGDADCNPIMDIEDLVQLLAKDPHSSFYEDK